MIKKTVPGVYSAPECEFAEELFEVLICESPEGTTEDFGAIDDFTW